MDKLPTLEQVDQDAWAHLTAASQSASALRCLTLASVDETGHPHARSLILRQVTAAAYLLEFHTDIRSEKWGELSADPRASVLGYDAELRIQLRFCGKVTLFGPGSELHAEAWNSLPAWNRNAYCGGPPGHSVAEPDIQGAQDAPPSNADTAKGQSSFGVIHFVAESLDWYQHGRGSNIRAQFDYVAGTRGWIMP